MVGEEKREGEWDCVCKRDKARDGRECESVRVGGGKERVRQWGRESRRWQEKR